MLHIKEIIVRRWPSTENEPDFEMWCSCETSGDYNMAFMIIRALISEHLLHDFDFRSQPVFCFPKNEDVKIEVFINGDYNKVNVVNA